MIKLKLVDDTMGASYINSEICFHLEDLAWHQIITNRRALSSDTYPDVILFCFKGSDIIFKARRGDWDKECVK